MKKVTLVSTQMNDKLKATFDSCIRIALPFNIPLLKVLSTEITLYNAPMTLDLGIGSIMILLSILFSSNEVGRSGNFRQLKTW